ncbi:hypothetical protein ABZS66_57305 [Dactylosporangium sp. NPDC005572]|uniref:DUF6841 family protein n=1 Tax=Dactylosporangium sp. NPDC005572 TaxID=3156889 RepID=UPI0033B32F12
MTLPANHSDVEDTRRDVTRWFFDDYLMQWESVVNRTRQDGPEFILGFWDCPLHVSLPPMNQWLTEPRDVTRRFASTQERLREAAYTNTVVLDARVTVFNLAGAAIAVIFSRRAGETEIERLAIHFQAARNQDGRWRIVGIQGIDTSARSLDDIWPIRHPHHHGLG